MARLKTSERAHVLSASRRRLLETAAEEITRLGYEATNINLVSLKAGFAKGTIYNYFPSKARLFADLVEWAAEEHCEFVSAYVMPEHDPRRRLERFFQAGHDFAANKPALAQVLVNALHGHQSGLKAEMYRLNLPVYRLLSQEILEPGIQLDLFRPVDREATVLMLMTLYFGGLSGSASGGPDHRQVAYFALNALCRS